MRFILIAAGLLLSAACTPESSSEQPNNSGPRLSVSHSLNILQCDTQKRSTDNLVAKLRAAGIEPLSASCGTDGRIYPQVCGGASGYIGIFEIPAQDAAHAQNLGFTPTLATAEKIPCSD